MSSKMKIHIHLYSLCIVLHVSKTWLRGLIELQLHVFKRNILEYSQNEQIMKRKHTYFRNTGNTESNRLSSDIPHKESIISEDLRNCSINNHRIKRA